MAELFSQYASGLQFTAGPIVGSATGVSGLNPIVDRINLYHPDEFTTRLQVAAAGLLLSADQ